MQIDLSKLLTNNVLLIDDKAYINAEYYKDADIKGLKDIIVKGKIYNSIDEEVILELEVNGVMQLEDAYNLEIVDYPFNFEIEENLKISQNSENILDITEILWQNIVLEVPISYSKNHKDENLAGEGWELKNKETKKIDSRFAKLTELLEKGKE